MAVPKTDEPTLWKPDRNESAKLKRELDCCEKENRSLNILIADIGEAVIRHLKGKT
jgi:hypothetical protein